MERVSNRMMWEAFRPFLTSLPLTQVWRMYRSLRNERPQMFNGQLRLNSFFPSYPSTAFNRFVAITAGKKRAPYQIYFAVTSACPYHCPHCSYQRRKPHHLSKERILEIIQQLKAEGTAILGFTGGEPLLHNDLEDFVAAAGPEMMTVIFTTGYTLNDDRAKRLADAGVGCVTIGFEAADASTHDAVRGEQGSFAIGRTALTACRNAGIYTAIGTIGTREKLKNGELERLYTLACQHDVQELRILSPVPTGSLTGSLGVMLTKVELEEIKKFHIAHNRARSGPVVSANAYLESPEMFGCNAGYHHCFIDASGEVCPCDLVPLSFGNLNEHSFHEIWETMGPLFPRPRMACLMSEIAGSISADVLPLPPEQATPLIPPSDPSKIPRLYRHLLPRYRRM